MATGILLKPSKWFSNYKGLRLPLPHLGRPKSSPTLTSPNSIPVSPRVPKKNTTMEDELNLVFNHFDGNGDGKISAVELRSYFGSVGEYLSHEDAQAVIDDLDSDGDNLLDLQDFMKLMKKEPNSLEGENNHRNNVNFSYDDDIKNAFEMFEMEKGSGCITPRSLQRMLCRLGDAKSYEECVAMIRVFDTDGNGVLDFHEFHQMLA